MPAVIFLPATPGSAPGDGSREKKAKKVSFADAAPASFHDIADEGDVPELVDIEDYDLSRRWLCDSACPYDLVSRETLAPDHPHPEVEVDESVTLATANGLLEATTTVLMQIENSKTTSSHSCWIARQTCSVSVFDH